MSQKRMQIENIGFKYKNNYGINQISFDVMKGDFIALVGENCAGKTTLIKAILGLLESEGDVLIEDEMEVNDISFCSQNISIDWYLSVYDNILMGGLFSRQSHRKIKQEIDQILDLVELKQYKKSDPNNLSGGQQQRIQIARSLMGSPKLIFLDEPTVGLDVVLANKLLKYLSYLCKQGTSIIIASHDLQLLEAYCNKVLYLKEGHMIYYGEIETFLNHYKHNDTLEISYEGELSVALIKEMNQIATVLNVKPLVVETVIEKKDQLIRMVVNSGVSINTIVTKGKTLREIIMEDQNEKINL